MLVLVLPPVSSRVSGFPVASPCLWGKPQNLPFRRFPSRLSCRFAWQAWHFVTQTCFVTCRKCQNWRKSRTKCSFFLHPRVSSRVSGFPVASPCLWGKLQNLSFSKVSKQVVMSFCVAGVTLCDIPTCVITCRKCQNLEEVSHEMLLFLHPRVSSRGLWFSCGIALSMGEAPHSILYTFTLHTPQFAL